MHAIRLVQASTLTTVSRLSLNSVRSKAIFCRIPSNVAIRTFSFKPTKILLKNNDNKANKENEEEEKDEVEEEIEEEDTDEKKVPLSPGSLPVDIVFI